MADTLLAHLIPRLPVQSEPIATQALTYVLNAAPDIAKAFMSVVHQTGFEPFERGRIAAEERHGDGIPDLTIWDTAGVVRVLVENKFWAGLTETQPVGYLDQLPSDAPAALLFVVPHTRLHIVWAELKKRCATKKIDRIRLAGDSSTNTGRNHWCPKKVVLSLCNSLFYNKIHRF